ncbi:MAG: type III-B CRISPR module RAMP protein Cmr1, partial [Lentisphaeria bacterium]
MEKKTYELTFITPCFCTGANQTEAEIRPASIRGALRWWFRLIGGTAQQEINVFGGIAGDENTASNLVIRVSDIKEGNSIYPTANNKFFTKNINPLQKSQSFTIIALLKKPKSLHLTEKLLLEKTLELFSVLGCLGRRANRGCGAIIPQEPISNEKLKKIISYAPKMLALKSSQTFNTAKETMEFLEETTKELRKRLRSDNGFIDA